MVYATSFLTITISCRAGPGSRISDDQQTAGIHRSKTGVVNNNYQRLPPHVLYHQPSGS